jgi:hypothetical protein
MLDDLHNSMGVVPVKTCNMTGLKETIAGFKSHGVWRQPTVSYRDIGNSDSSRKQMGKYGAV